MKKIFITGVGLVSEAISDTKQLSIHNIDQYPIVKSSESIEELLTKNYIFKSKDIISREDRALLNKMSHLAIDASVQAFDAEFSHEEKLNFPIFMANEAADHNFAVFDNLLSSKNGDVDYCLANLGDVKKYLNPLDMLRLLSTNALYHLSKIFNLQGGGYPIRRMSLSGMCALQEACNQMRRNQSRALVTAVGDLTNPENLCAFLKMGLIKMQGKPNGILPSFGAASLILENEDVVDNSKKIYASIRTVKSIYKNNTTISKKDWISLFTNIRNEIPDLSEPHIVAYNNGVVALAEAEKDAIETIFPESPVFAYKKYIGYTGKANNLIDLIIALSDKRIPCGHAILINGIGTSVGFGSILIEKINHV